MSKSIFFGGRWLVVGERADAGFLLEDIGDGFQVTGTSAWKLDGAFVTPHPEGGFFFVEGPGAFGMPDRKALSDNTIAGELGVKRLTDLGVRFLSNAEAQADLDASGVGIYNVNAEEQRRRTAEEQHHRSRGRPSIGEKPMTSTERNKRRMERLRQIETAAREAEQLLREAREDVITHRKEGEERDLILEFQKRAHRAWVALETALRDGRQEREALRREEEGDEAARND